MSIYFYLHIYSCSVAPARLFIFDRGKIQSNEGTTQSDPTLRGAYALGILPMLYYLLDLVLTNDLQTREVAFDDDFTVAGKLTDIKNFWDKLATIGSRYRYFPISTKSYFLVKKKLPKRCKDHVY